MVGRNVKGRREAAGMTQVDLARAVGTMQSTISGIETGARMASLPMLARLAAALGCEPAELLANGTGDSSGSVAPSPAGQSIPEQA